MTQDLIINIEVAKVRQIITENLVYFSSLVSFSLACALSLIPCQCITGGKVKDIILIICGSYVGPEREKR